MSEIIVASTTDSQEAIERAAGMPAEGAGAGNGELTREPEDHAEVGSGQEEYTAESEAVAESEGGDEADRDTGDEESEESASRRRPRKSRMQKRFDTLTRRIYEQQEQLDALRERVATSGPEQTSPSRRAEAAQAPADGKPTPASYRSYDEYIEALADWKAGQRLQQQKQAETAQAEQQRTQEVFETYNEAANAARTKYDDFEEVVGRKDLKIPQAAQIAIIEAGEAGPDIAYYLGKHPEVCRELATMSPMRAVARVGQIESALTGSRSLIRSGAAQERRTMTAAPAPITPVSGTSRRAGVPLGDLPYRDYKRIRDQEERAQR